MRLRHLTSFLLATSAAAALSAPLFANTTNTAPEAQHSLVRATPTPASLGNAAEDTDGDGIPDGVDCCPYVYNPDQADLDGDGFGNVCDDDADGDGVRNALDNCPLVANPNQMDRDRDGLGDLCDDDADGDGIVNWVDQYPFDSRPEGPDGARNDGASVMADLRGALGQDALVRLVLPDGARAPELPNLNLVSDRPAAEQARARALQYEALRLHLQAWRFENAAEAPPAEGFARREAAATASGPTLPELPRTGIKARLGGLWDDVTSAASFVRRSLDTDHRF